MPKQLTKRVKFVTSSASLSLGFVAVQLLENQLKFVGIGFLSVFTVILFFWFLRDGLGKNATLLTLILPFFYTLGVGLFWFLLPANLITRFPVIILYSLGIYALATTMNIFVVSASRAIPLSRAAKAVSFTITLFTAFLIYDAIFSLKLEFYFNALMVFPIAFLLFLQGIWSSKHQKKFSKELLSTSLVFALCTSLITYFVHFWPVKVVVSSLMVTAFSYVLLGLGQSKHEGRLFKQTVREYMMVAAIVFLFALLAASWRG